MCIRDRYGYLGTGYNDNYQKDFWKFDPSVGDKGCLLYTSYVRFRSGCNITVVSAKKDGIHTNESVIIGGGILNISSDGLSLIHI